MTWMIVGNISGMVWSTGPKSWESISQTVLKVLGHGFSQIEQTLVDCKAVITLGIRIQKSYWDDDFYATTPI